MASTEQTSPVTVTFTESAALTVVNALHSEATRFERLAEEEAQTDWAKSYRERAAELRHVAALVTAQARTFG